MTTPRFMGKCVLATVLAGLLGMSVASLAQSSGRPGIPEVNLVEVSYLVDQVTSDPQGWRWGLQEALARKVEFGSDDFLAQLRDALSDVDADLSPRELARAIVLVRLARTRSVTKASHLFHGMLDREGVSDRVRYEIARALSSLSRRREEVLSLLDARSDPVVAGAIDEVGDTKDEVIQRRLRALLARRGEYHATRTGDALARLELLNEYKEFWASHTNTGQRLDFLVQRAGEMYLPIPPPSPAVRGDGLVASWVRNRVEEMHRENPELVNRRISAELETAPVNADYLRLALEELQNER